MKIKRKLHTPGGLLAMFFTCYLYFPSVNAGLINDTEWKVTRGDSLYAISRAIYPGDTVRQARLRRDIMELNPSVFAAGANNMNVGIVLKLPDYLAQESATSKVGGSKPVPKSGKVTAESDVTSVTVGGNEWKVRRNDTLYAICRTIFPGDARNQARLGRDIKKLNPTVFANGVNNLKVGVVLKLPDYVAPGSIPSKAEGLAPAQMQDEVAIKPVAPGPVVEPQRETPTLKKQPASSPSRAGGNTVVSFGFSQGGDQLVKVNNGPDIYAGTGVQLRLGYEKMFQPNGGYRASLGFQYYTLFEQRDVSFRDIYLQLAYQYRLYPVVCGLGVVVDSGAKLESNINANYDPAIGAVLYLEYAGNGKLAGWGLGATSLSIKEKNSGSSFRASRAEVYYSWKF